MNQEQIMDILAPIITALAPVLTALVGWLILTLRKQVEVKTAAIKHEELRKWVTTLVMSAEQQFATIGKDEEKLAYATEETLLFVQSLGLTLTREQVRALIEAAVHAMTIEEAAATSIPVVIPATSVS